jgi:hypothetical protein
MQDKKITMVVVTIIAILAFALVSFFVLQGKETNEIGTSSYKSKTGIIFPKRECYYDNDLMAMGDALAKYDVGVCDCVKEENSKKTCVATVQDATVFNQAVMATDVGMCDQIKKIDEKKNCKDAVQGKIDFMKK